MLKLSKNLIVCLLLVFVNVMTVNAYYQAPIDITNMDIFDIQAAIDNDLLTYETLMRLYIDRINAYNSQYKALITINDNAIEEAKLCDQNKDFDKKSMLYCMPIIVKDNIDVEGMPTTAGTKSLSDSYPNEDAKLVKNLIDKGAIIIGKANMSEFAFLANSSSSSYGTVKNAYNTKYSSYGSSGGSAVAVATSLAALGIGTDTNSSVRAPSAANNLYGMRPTFGLVDTSGLLQYDITRDTVGPITKTARENALLLAVMTGNDENTYIGESPSLENKTIGVLTQFVDGSDSLELVPANAKVKELFYDTLEKLKESGVNVVEINNFYKSNHKSAFSKTTGGWTMCYSFNKYIKNTTSSIKTFVDLSLDYRHIYDISDYVNACYNDINVMNTYPQIKQSFLDDFESLFAEYGLDAVVYPTTSNILSKVGEDNYQSNCSKIAPVLGVPSLTIPMGEISGLYYGMDLVGLKNTEAKLYDFALAYDEVYATYVPPAIAPSLYEVPQSVEELKDIYLNNKNIKFKFTNKKITEYYNTLEEIKNFFMDYNNYDNHSELAKTLLDEFNNNIKNLGIYIFINYNFGYIIVIGIFCLLVIIKKIKQFIGYKNILRKG